MSGHPDHAESLSTALTDLSNALPRYWLEYPDPIPATRQGKRKVIPVLKVLIDAVGDKDMEDFLPGLWGRYYAALGRYVDRHREEVFGSSVQHNLKIRRREILEAFVAEWDAGVEAEP